MNKRLAAAGLNSTVKTLERMARLEEYHEIMREQITNGITEPVPPLLTEEIVHYVSYQAVIRENTGTTKMRIVYDCLVRANIQSLSLNDCLETGPPLQPILFDILACNRMRTY